jgi:DNA-binding response OmpR family regulator
MSTLDGRAILVVEDEPLVAFDICQSLAEAGAQVIAARTRAQALEAATSQDVAAAVLDLVLGDGSKDLCDELANRGIPFVIYSGMPKPPDVSNIFIEKPASSDRLVTALQGLLF